MSLGRHAPAGAAIALAIAALGFTVSRERAHDADERARNAEIRGLTRAIAEMRSDLATEHPGGGAAPSGEAPRCAFDAAQIQAIAVGVGAVLSRSPSQVGGKRPEAEPAPERTVEQEVAIAKAGDLIDAVIRKGGTPSRDDMMKVQAQMAAAGPSPEVEALQARIAQAVNMGKIALDRP